MEEQPTTSTNNEFDGEEREFTLPLKIVDDLEHEVILYSTAPESTAR